MTDVTTDVSAALAAYAAHLRDRVVERRPAGRPATPGTTTTPTDAPPTGVVAAPAVLVGPAGGQR